MRGQRNAILAHLKTGKPITSREAFELYGVTRLSAIIHDLRNMGYIIHTLMIDGTTRFGDSTKYGKYILAHDINEEEN